MMREAHLIPEIRIGGAAQSQIRLREAAEAQDSGSASSPRAADGTAPQRDRPRRLEIRPLRPIVLSRVAIGAHSPSGDQDDRRASPL
jgi:hypothetical protein